MGRELSPLEAKAFIKEGSSVQDKKLNVSKPASLNLQAQIVAALDLSVEALNSSSPYQSTILEAVSEAQTAEIAMNQDCLDLIGAYIRIVDPEERQRLLKIVRDAATKDIK